VWRVAACRYTSGGPCCSSGTALPAAAIGARYVACGVRVSELLPLLLLLLLLLL
jgi:hypothetical protein